MKATFNFIILITFIFSVTLTESRVIASENNKEEITSQDQQVEENASRVEFFKLIQGTPELISAEKEKAELKDKEPERKLASDHGKELYDFLLGKSNVDPNREITTYLEVRKFEGNTSVLFRDRAQNNSPIRYRLNPGKIIRVTDNTEKYLNMLRLQKRNQAAWKSVAVNDKVNPKNLHFLYDWKKVYAVNPNLQPVELELKIPYGRNAVTVFSKPGRWSWQDCKANEELCVGWPDKYAKVFLFDTALVDLKDHMPNQTDYHLFYQVGFAYKSSEGKFKYGVGWISSDLAVRQINYLPSNIFQQRGPAGDLFLSEKQRREKFQSLFLFDKNAQILSSENNRWSKDTAGSGHSIFDIKVAYDAVLKTSYAKMDQNFLPDPLIQYGITPGIAVSAPIFMDVEMQGIATVTAPVATESEGLDPAYILKLDQWLNYTAPMEIAETPIKFGLGFYYLAMLGGSSDYGFNSLVGFQTQVMLENRTTWAYVRFGAMGADLNFKFRNREFGAGIGYRLNPERKFDGWSVFAEVSDIDYSSPKTGTLTRFDQVHIGVKKGF